MDMVRAVNMKKYYIADTYEVRALDGVSLTAEEGEIGRASCRERV